MYFSANHIDIKLNQDYSDFLREEALIICDGIGEFHESGKVSKKVTELIIDKAYNSIDNIITDSDLEKFKTKITSGGTTILFAKKKSNSKIYIEYLGNGGIIHLQGNFANNVNVDVPYRYSEIMLPHITPKGELDKHLSHNSQKEDYSPTKLSLTLNQKSGDILIFFTDGISSLEDKVILKDDEGRYWRYEPSSIQFILSELNSFLRKLQNNSIVDFNDDLSEFIKATLKKLKQQNMLEDDASIGIIITEPVINYYKSVVND